MHVVRKHELGIPQNSREAFDVRQTHALLDGPLATAMKRMVGFRNVAVHEYDKLNLDIVKAIITKRLDDVLTFGKHLLRSEA
jgi:uncharacterized protein YutE (UPF0331/DUF86 family)